MNWLIFIEFVIRTLAIYLTFFTLWRFITAKTYRNTFCPWETIVMSACWAWLVMT